MNDIIMTKKHKTININIDKILRSTYKTVLKRFAKFCINTFRKMCNLRIKQIIKVIKINPKISIKTILI